jgi:hypothetical protein
MNSKGQSSELIELLILIVGVSIALIISYFFFATGTPKVSNILIESHKYDRLTDITNEFYYTKIAGTERTLSQLLGDRIASGKNPVLYGKDWGNIDVDNLTVQFFDTYFNKKWRFSVAPPGEISVGIIVDTSSSTLQSSIEIIKQKLPAILEDLESRGKIIYVNFFLLGGESYTKCSDFQDMKYTSCSVLSVSLCGLAGQQSEDWGNGVACVANNYKPAVAIIISDEPSGGCEPCLQAYAPSIGPIADSSITNGINTCKAMGTRVFTLTGTFPCGTSCGMNPIYCVSTCDQCCVKNTKTVLERIAEQTDGQYYDLSEGIDAGDIVKYILESIPVKETNLGYEMPKDISRVQTFEMLIPVPTIGNQVVKGYLYVW